MGNMLVELSVFGSCYFSGVYVEGKWIKNKNPSSHNHGSVKNGCISNSSYLSTIAIFHFHDYGRKSNGKMLVEYSS